MPRNTLVAPNLKAAVDCNGGNNPQKRIIRDQTTISTRMGSPNYTPYFVSSGPRGMFSPTTLTTRFTVVIGVLSRWLKIIQCYDWEVVKKN